MPVEEPSPVDLLTGGGAAPPDTEGGELQKMGNLLTILGEPLILLEKEDAEAKILHLELDDVRELEISGGSDKRRSFRSTV